jgi:protein TonB
MSKLILRCGALVVLALSLSASVRAGQGAGRGPCGGGVVDGLALSKPAPVYPRRARAAGVWGTVTVQVRVDEEGKVTEARVCSGHPLLRASAVEAAYRARIRPNLVGGRPEAFTGVLSYKFARRARRGR